MYAVSPTFWKVGEYTARCVWVTINGIGSLVKKLFNWIINGIGSLVKGLFTWGYTKPVKALKEKRERKEEEIRNQPVASEAVV